MAREGDQGGLWAQTASSHPGTGNTAGKKSSCLQAEMWEQAAFSFLEVI